MDWQTVVALALVSAAGLALLPRGIAVLRGGAKGGCGTCGGCSTDVLKTIERPLVKISSGNRSDRPDSR